MQFRTDLALEIEEGQVTHREMVGSLSVDEVVLDEKTARRYHKPPGRYLTATIPPLTDREDELQQHAEVIGRYLQTVLPPDGTVLVVGLGNGSITPDALGPRVASMVLATRHIQGEFARSTGLDGLRSTAVMATDVMGNTGMESGEVILGVCRMIQPCAVIAVDALAARDVARLGCTVQLSDTGIAPGSGVGNNRLALNRETLGIPVIGLGVPTVVDAATLACDLTGVPQESVSPRGAAMMVTPREVDLMVSRASRLLAMSIHGALHPDYSPLELLSVAMA